MTIEKSFIYDLCQNSSIEEISGTPREALAVDEDHDWELGSGSKFFVKPFELKLYTLARRHDIFPNDNVEC
jgi:hypothetical protein